MKLVKSGPTGSDETATYDVVEYPKNVVDFVNKVLERTTEWGSIAVEGYGYVEYRYGKLLIDIPKIWNELTINYIEASGGWSYMNYDISVEQQEKIPSCIDFEDIARDYANKEYPPYYEMPDDNWQQRAGYVKGFKAGIKYQKDKYNKLKAVSHKLYTAAQYLSDNPNSAESLREAMKEYYNFINDIKV